MARRTFQRTLSPVDEGQAILKGYLDKAVGVKKILQLMGIEKEGLSKDISELLGIYTEKKAKLDAGLDVKTKEVNVANKKLDDSNQIKEREAVKLDSRVVEVKKEVVKEEGELATIVNLRTQNRAVLDKETLDIEESNKKLRVSLEGENRRLETQAVEMVTTLKALDENKESKEGEIESLGTDLDNKKDAVQVVNKELNTLNQVKNKSESEHTLRLEKMEKEVATEGKRLDSVNSDKIKKVAENEAEVVKTDANLKEVKKTFSEEKSKLGSFIKRREMSDRREEKIKDTYKEIGLKY